MRPAQYCGLRALYSVLRGSPSRLGLRRELRCVVSSSYIVVRARAPLSTKRSVECFELRIFRQCLGAVRVRRTWYWPLGG